MSPRLNRLIRHPWRPWRIVPASTHSATRGFLIALSGSLLTFGLVAWDYRERMSAMATDSSRHQVELGVLLALALVVAIATITIALLYYWRFRTLARAELHDLADLDAAGETLRALLGTVSHGVILTDVDGRIRLFNPAAEILFGRLCEETLTLPIEMLIPDLRLSEVIDSARASAGLGSQVLHLSGVRADDRHFPMRLLTRPLTLDGEDFRLLIAEDMTDLERSEQRMEFLEQRDPLTGLQNRPTFERILGAVTPLRGKNPKHALCLIDIDRFKVINDSFGHAAGNKVLEQLGQIAKTKLGTATALARLSGDEIVALFVGDAANQAKGLCEDLIRTTRNFLFTWQERSFDITLSIGLVVFDPAKMSAVDALGHADIACRTAKKQGRDRIHVYGHRDAESVRHRGDLALLPVIGRALSDGRFRIMAQPIQPLNGTDQPIHYEILARMQDEKGNAVVPDAFIPAAERHILMPTIDRWIVTHVFSHQSEQLTAWHAAVPDRFMLAINLSGTTLMDEGFTAYLKRQFAEYAIPYASICFEITETAAVADLRRARTFMQEMRALGTSFAVDDFGTGFASYAYLKLLPVDYLKIDGSFVRNLETDPVDRALVSSINHIGHVLGMKTIAEWAETPELIERLRAMGVDYAQGFGVGRPLRLEDLRLHRALRQDSPERPPAAALTGSIAH
ncbi:putative bifunctional diguanylate cyclase/phosphodiesterase [Thiocapsa marina]|uniref:Diguanylate cyclase/phosphodiesterase with PAS/PAC sensor(S) n=1 Tax=Thiocapsa marina 5811 TaxID=768671 RepID=F9UAC2_9GAMM|nr:EAL domain-containing protein [Thiocapsa marina]EGV19070.1 diguanylate cyclase/phosphodiesterase with PAS/PAC sensor(s) [Thiocapsa marina 5811]